MNHSLSPLALRFFACCAGITALTTLVVHLVSFPANTFDERIALHTNPLYLTRLWVIMLHIALALVSMWGMALLLWRRSPSATGIGFMGFLLFAWGELMRMALAIFVVNRGWRAEYAATTDASVQAILREMLTTWGYVNNTLFFLFITGFTVGTLCYGLVLLRRSTAESVWDRRLGAVLLVWAASNSLAIFEGAGLTGIPALPEWFGWTFQPLARVGITVWFWNYSLRKGEQA